MRILYVEDNEVNQALVERVMRARDCSVVFSDEGEDALEILANDPEIRLILLDVELAGSFSGLDVIRALRARNDRRPVVAITAYAMMGDRERILEAGCDQYLPKPLVVTDLLNLIDDYQAQFARQAQVPTAAAAPAVTAPTPAEPMPVTMPADGDSKAEEKPATVPVIADAPSPAPQAAPTAADDGAPQAGASPEPTAAPAPAVIEAKPQQVGDGQP